MRENANKKRIVLVFGVAVITVAVSICGLFFSIPTDINTKPVGGVLDLESWDVEGDGILSLIGEWDFYWNSFITYQDITNNNVAPDLTVTVPLVWNNYKIEGKSLPGFGYATYRLSVVNATEGEPLAFRLPAFATSYEFYVNDRLLTHDGTIGVDKEHSIPGCKPQLVAFTPSTQSFDIIVYVANFSYALGGMGYPIKMGTAEQIQSMDKVIAVQDLLLFGGLTIMAFFFLNIFLLRREDKFSLYLVFVCVFMAGSTAISGDLLILSFFPNISYEIIIKIMYIVLCCFPIFTALAIGELFPKEISKNILHGLFVYTACMTPIILLATVSFYSRFYYVVYAIQFLNDFYFFLILARAAIRGRKDAPFLLVCYMAVIFCYGHEMLFYSNANKLAYFIILIILSFSLAKRLTEAYRTESDLSQKLLTLDKIKDETIAKALTAEAAFLQAQIKPHFLYNTLNTISSFCDTDPAQAGRLIDEFSDYLRQSFDFKNIEMLVPIKQELRLVQSYVAIEKVRFGYDLIVMFNVDDTVTTKIPLLSIQPLVENAINHGLRKKSGGGTVIMTVQRAADGVEISVHDDGQGILEEKLKSLLLPEDGQGIGLWNIDKRLKKLYGTGLKIDSEINKGTTVTYCIPKEAEAND